MTNISLPEQISDYYQDYLCIRSDINSEVKITDSNFTNIAGNCIVSFDGDKLFIKNSFFSNENMREFLQTLLLQEQSQAVSWIRAEGVDKLSIQDSTFHSNYLSTEKGGVLLSTDVGKVILRRNIIKNTRANKGGCFFISNENKMLDKFTIKENQYSNIISDESGGVFYVEAGIAFSNKITLNLKKDIFTNCTSKYFGSLIYSKGVQLKVQSAEIIPVDENPNLQFFLISESKKSQFDDIKIKFNTNKTHDNSIPYIRYFPMNSDPFASVIIKNSSQFNNNTISNKIPFTMKVCFLELNKWQVKIQNQTYLEEVEQKINSGNLSEFSELYSKYFNITESNQYIPSTIQSKSGSFLSQLVVIQLFDQFGNIYQDNNVKEDCLGIELVSLNDNKSHTSMDGQKLIQFSSKGQMILNPFNKYISEIGTLRLLKLSSQSTSNGNFIHIFDSIHLQIPIKFLECDTGDIYRSSIQTCETCPIGLYSFSNPNDKTTTCQKCEDGLECLGSDLIVPQPKYWKLEKKSTIPLKCPREDDCLGGVLNEVSVPLQQGYCKTPSTGHLCNQCEIGFVRPSPQESCVDCSKNVGYYILSTVMFTFQLLIIIVVIIATIKSSVNKISSQPRSLKMKESADYNNKVELAKEAMNQNLFYLSQLIRNGFNYFETIRKWEELIGIDFCNQSL